MITSNITTYRRWLVEGSNGQILRGPTSFEEAIRFVSEYEDRINGSYSAEGPMPKFMSDGHQITRLGYLLRKVNVQVVETY